MHSRRLVPEPLRRLADLQAGVLTVEQAAAFNVTPTVVDRLCREGWWQRLARGLLWLGDGTPPWLALAWAGVLVAGDDARLGGDAAAHLWQLHPDPPDVLDVLLPYPRNCTVRGPWRFHREQPGLRSSRTVGGPPRLTAADTVLDLTASADEGTVVDVVTRAMVQRILTPSILRDALNDRQRHPNRALLEALLIDVAEGIESPLELRYLRQVERAHGLPEGDRQRYRGGLRHRTDVGYDEWALLVELDGRRGHEGMGRFRDYRRDNAFALRQLVTLRYGWFDVVNRPCEVARQVALVLQSRGWPGPFSRCRQCLLVPDLVD